MHRPWCKKTSKQQAVHLDEPTNLPWHNESAFICYLAKIVRVLVFLSIIVLIASEEEKEEEEEEEEKYLYAEDADPVVDYHADNEKDPNRPSFLYSPDNGPRIVEFYAPWCPHCRHFRDHYVHFAHQITTLAKENNVDVKVFAVSCTVHKSICKAFGIHSYPKIHLLAAGATNTTARAEYWKLHPFQVLNQLGVHTDNLNLNEQQQQQQVDTAIKINKKKKQDTVLVHKRTKQEVFDDAYLSFDFALRNGIFMSDGPLTNKTQDAFKDWLELLQQAMPPAWTIQALVKELLENFESIVKSEAALLAIADKHPPKTKRWSLACTHGDKGAGYTCGLWELFHIMTVGVVEWNLMIDDADASDASEIIIATEQAAVTLRNFVANFFGCEVCRLNFLHAFDTCANDRCNRLSEEVSGNLQEWLQLPVWLFETHNSVNVRLLKEKGKREGWTPTHADEIAKQWPSRESCPKCWNTDGGWSDVTIYKYLRIEYWPEDFITAEYRKEVLITESEDDESYSLPSALRILPFAIVIGLLVGSYVKRRELNRTGRHKKVDEVVCVANGV